MADKRSKEKRGFAAMDPAKVAEFARRGGEAAQRGGKAHKFTSEEAKAAGRKGGLAARKKREETEPEAEA